MQLLSKNPPMPNPPAYTPQELTAFIKAVQDTSPLDIADPADQARYVPHLQGPRNALGRLKSEITHQEGDGVYLFTGQIGSGKSTELLRLKKELESPQCKVYYCDLSDWLNLSAPIDLVSMLLGLVASWIEKVGEGRGTRTPFERLTDFLTRTNINLEKINLGADIGAAKTQIQLALKTDEAFRASLEQTLKNNVSAFVNQAHRFVAELVADICPQGEKCVLIADSLEKIRGYGAESEKVYESVERLFLSEGAALHLPSVHVVYSVSPFLLAQNPQLPGILGQGVVVNMPSVHVFKKRSTELDPEGVGQMTNLLQLRYAGWQAFFTPDFLQQMIRDCGGDLRDYLRAIKVVLLEMEAEPGASEEELLSAVRSQISPPKLIPTADIAWMARLERSHDPELDDKITSLAFQRYLATKHILAYLNGDAWYAIHPLLREWVMGRPEAQPAPVYVT
jgi:hypothetical protein